MKYYLYLMPTCLVVSFAGRVWVIIEFFAMDEDINITPNDAWYLKYLLGGFSALIFGQFFDGGKKLESIWGVKLLFILGSVLAALGYEIAADRLVILGAICLGFGTMALFSLMLSFFYYACTNTLSSLQCNSLTGAISSFLMYYYYGALLWHLCYVGCGGNEYFTLGTGILITVISVVTLGKFNYHHKLEGNL